MSGCPCPVLGSIVRARRPRPRRDRAWPVASACPTPGQREGRLPAGRQLPAAGRVRVVSRDRLARPAPGPTFTICYVNAFQTQPGQLRWWRVHHPGALLRKDGRLVRDPGWRDEVLLDTSTVSQAPDHRQRRRRLDRPVPSRPLRGRRAGQPRLVLPLASGCSPGQDNLALAHLLAARAHAAGLSIAQKNLAGLSRERRPRSGSTSPSPRSARGGGSAVATAPPTAAT